MFVAWKQNYSAFSEQLDFFDLINPIWTGLFANLKDRGEPPSS